MLIGGVKKAVASRPDWDIGAVSHYDSIMHHDNFSYRQVY